MADTKESACLQLASVIAENLTESEKRLYELIGSQVREERDENEPRCVIDELDSALHDLLERAVNIKSMLARLHSRLK